MFGTLENYWLPNTQIIENAISQPNTPPFPTPQHHSSLELQVMFYSIKIWSLPPVFHVHLTHANLNSKMSYFHASLPPSTIVASRQYRNTTHCSFPKTCSSSNVLSATELHSISVLHVKNARLSLICHRVPLI